MYSEGESESENEKEIHPIYNVDEELEKLQKIVKSIKDLPKDLNSDDTNVELPPPLTKWGYIKLLHQNLIKLIKGKKVLCSICHQFKSNGTKTHNFVTVPHSFQNCPSKNLKGINKLSHNLI